MRFAPADAFWQPRRESLLKTTLPSQWATLNERGRLDDLRRAAGRLDGPTQGIYSFDDTDLYKWLEAASACVATFPKSETEELQGWIAEAVALIADAQEPDGYLNSYYTGERRDQRWTKPESHELYTAGHLFQAAVAHHQATGSARLLQVAVRFADLVYARGTGFLDAHPQVELALVQLARATGNSGYLILAQAHLDARGHGRLGKPYRYFEPDYALDHVPYRELTEVTGHAVRMIYLATGAAEICAETGEKALRVALERQWENMVGARAYVTGGLGSRHDGEAFGRDHELPSATAYAETCAAIASVQWNERLLALTGKARYADAMERALYNAALAGISLDGTRATSTTIRSGERRLPRAPALVRLRVLPAESRAASGADSALLRVDDLPKDGALRMTLWIGGRRRKPDSTRRRDRLRWRVETRMPWDGDDRR